MAAILSADHISVQNISQTQDSVIFSALTQDTCTQAEQPSEGA